MSVFRKKKIEEFLCKIYTIDAELQFPIEVNDFHVVVVFSRINLLQTTARGSTIFSLVCQTIGLRECWYFGLKYQEKTSNEWKWLDMNRSVCVNNLIE